jgi:hypothetical protein
MKRSRASSLAVLAATLLAIAGCETKGSSEGDQDEAAPSLPARAARTLRAAPEYTAIEGTAGGLRQATLYSQKLRASGSTFEVRSLLLLPKKSALPADSETLYEVLTGEVESESGDARQLHKIGDLWIVSKGKRVAVRATGEIAVLRAIVVSAK